VSDMVGCFTFGATMHGFFIVHVAFFGDMVVACGSERGERAARKRGQGEGGEVGACSVHEPAGSRK
jgi:hypothetical protein